MNPRIRFWGAILVAAVVYYAMHTAIGDTPSWGDEPAGLGGEESQMTPLVTSLFDTHVLTLEVLGILLTAAMIGALVIARPLGQAPDKSHYDSDPHLESARPTPAVLADMGSPTTLSRTEPAPTEEESE